MAEIEGSLADDRQVIGCVGGCGTKSPWKTTASSAEAPVMGAHSWPALSNAASNNPPTSIRTPAQVVIMSPFLVINSVAEPGNEKQVQASPLPPVPQGDPGQPWQHQRDFDPRNMPHGAGPRNFVRPPYTGHAPGFMVGPGACILLAGSTPWCYKRLSSTFCSIPWMHDCFYGCKVYCRCQSR
ncbi:La-related protein 1A [Raphanus sativus]|nr:La-related protein 1A [Raphanus sativus]